MKIGTLEKLRLGFGVYAVDGEGDGGSASDGDGANQSDGGNSDLNGNSNSAISQGSNQTFQESMPEKFRVFEGEGDAATFNLEGSAKKLLDSYVALEKRGGAPESVDDYSIDGTAIGDDFSFDDFKKDEANQSFLKSMHAAGLNNSQVQKVLEFGIKELMPGLTEGSKFLNTEESVNYLQSEVWKDGQEYKENMALANKAYSSLSGELQEKINDPNQPGGTLGNHPLFNEVMALFGKEMREDRPPNQDTGMGDAVNIEELMSSEAYKNPKDPQHKKVSEQVQAYFNKKFPSKAS